MKDLISLRCLTAGELGEVGQIVGDPHQVHRLEELGLREGTTVEMVRPGSPCIIRLSGHKLCFRPTAGLNVLVRRV